MAKKSPYAFKTQRLTPYKTGARPVYLVCWYDRDGARKCSSLGTHDEGQARRICIDLETICNAPALWDKKPTGSELSHLNGKARQIFFGLPDEPKTMYRGLIDLRTIDSRSSFGGDAATGQRPVVNVEIKAAQDEYEKRVESDRENDALKKKLDEREKEIEDLRKRLNLHCPESLADAVAKYNAHYAVGHDPHTAGQVKAILAGLIASRDAGFKLGDLTGAMISDFVTNIKAEDGSELSPVTRRKKQAYISAFCSWATKQYVLILNPMMHVHAVAGANSQSVPTAITKYDDLTDYLDALKPWPYWRAWVAFACLAGPRWAEQTKIKVGDLSEAYTEVTINASKTKRIRKTPVEGKILRPILKEYIAWHRQAEDTDLLFPSPVQGHGARADRRWRSSTWHKHWSGGWDPKQVNGKLVKKGKYRQGVKELISAGKAEDTFWHYGPDEWRHTAATAMGHADVGALRISQWIGNSEAICRKFYVSAIDSKVWPLRYVMKQH